MSTPIELNNLVERVGLEAAIAAVRGWIGRQDAERFLAGEAARVAPAGILPPAWRQAEPPAPGTEDEGLAAASSCAEACPCEANRGADCDCWEDRFREDDGGLAAASSAEPRAEHCSLHWTQTQSAAGGGAMLGPTHNGRGYSTMSPPCNGCPIGQRERDAGIWHSGFGEERNVFYQGATGPMQPLYPVGGPAPLAGWRGTLTVTPTGGGLAPTSSEWESGGAALAPTASAPPPVDDRYRLFSRLQTVMLDCLREAENAPTKWAIDNLVNAMERFREVGGADGDNYRYCQERLAELDR